jgi:hypothetical protein
VKLSPYTSVDSRAVEPVKKWVLTIERCDNVSVTPEEINKTVLNRGKLKGGIGSIPKGGHVQ